LGVCGCKGEPREGTLEIQATLERALDIAPGHPGLTHLYIHEVEMSPRPEIALEVADRIYTLVPDSAHMIHMATHIYLSLGMYDKTIELNQVAVDCDRKYLSHEANQQIFKFYVAHNWHFIVYAATMEGQYALARNAAEEMRKVLPMTGEPLPYQVMNELTDGFATMLYHVLMRFGKWEEILSLPFPQPAELYPFCTATLRFTRAIAYASMGKVNDALDEEQLFLEAWNNIPPDAMFIFNTCRRVLEVAKEMLRGEIKYRQADYRQAFEHLRKAVQLEDSLRYDEPWAWTQPVRHALGALLLEQGRLNEAEEAFRQDLSKRGSGASRSNPNNIWSLVGMQQCLEKMGRTEEAKRIAATLKKARDVADTPIRTSCFCATELINKPAST
jgi:tetratricopeptide (TPR) repeat protein